MRLLANLYQLLGGARASINNLYVIDTCAGLVLFDTPETETELCAFQRELTFWGLDTRPFAMVLLTHRHYGHISYAPFFRSKGAQIVAGELDAQAIEAGDIHAINDFAPFPVKRFAGCKVDKRVRAREQMICGEITITALHVPGHTPGSMVYAVELNGQKILFVGDCMSVGTDCNDATLCWTGGEGYDPQLYLSSLCKLKNTPCDILLPAHGQACMQNGDEILQYAYSKALLQLRGPYIAEE